MIPEKDFYRVTFKDGDQSKTYDYGEDDYNNQVVPFIQQNNLTQDQYEVVHMNPYSGDNMNDGDQVLFRGTNQEGVDEEAWYSGADITLGNHQDFASSHPGYRMYSGEGMVQGNGHETDSLKRGLDRTVTSQSPAEIVRDNAQQKMLGTWARNASVIKTIDNATDENIEDYISNYASDVSDEEKDEIRTQLRENGIPAYKVANELNGEQYKSYLTNARVSYSPEELESAVAAAGAELTDEEREQLAKRLSQEGRPLTADEINDYTYMHLLQKAYGLQSQKDSWRNVVASDWNALGEKEKNMNELDDQLLDVYKELAHLNTPQASKGEQQVMESAGGQKGFFSNVWNSIKGMGVNLESALGIALQSAGATGGGAKASLDMFPQTEGTSERDALYKEYASAMADPNLTDSQRKDLKEKIRGKLTQDWAVYYNTLTDKKDSGEWSRKFNDMMIKENRIINAIERAGGDIYTAKAMLMKDAGQMTTADELVAEAEKMRSTLKTPEGFWGKAGAFTGGIVPIVAGAAATAATGNPTFAKVGVGAVVGSAAGQSMQAAKDYGASDREILSVGFSTAAIEAVAMKFALNRYTSGMMMNASAASERALASGLSEATGDAVVRYVAGQANATMANLGNRILVSEEATKELVALLGKYTTKGMIKGAAERITLDAIGMAGTRAIADAMQTAVPTIYENPEDYPVLHDYLKSAEEGLVNGFIMGAVFAAGSEATTGMRTWAFRHQNGIRKAESLAKKGDLEGAAKALAEKGEITIGLASLGEGRVAPVEIVGYGDGVVKVSYNGRVIDLPNGNLIYVNKFTPKETEAYEAQYEADYAYAEGKRTADKEMGLLGEAPKETVSEDGPKLLTQGDTLSEEMRDKGDTISSLEIKARASRAAEVFEETFGYAPDESINGEWLTDQILNGNLTQDQKAAAYLYVKAKEAYNGYIQGKKANEIVQEADKLSVKAKSDHNPSGKFWVGEEGSETVRPVVRKDGVEGYIVKEGENGGVFIQWSDGDYDILAGNEYAEAQRRGRITERESAPVRDYLTERAQIQEERAERLRMMEQEQKMKADVQTAVLEEATAHQGKVNVGTTELPVWAKVNKDIVSEDGVYLDVPRADGSTETKGYTWKELGDLKGMPTSAMTNAEIEAAAMAEILAAYDDEKHPKRNSYIEGFTGMEGAQTPSVPRDFRGNPLPMKENGSVNAPALWEKDPEAWMHYNAEQRGDYGVDSLEYVENAKDNLTAQIEKKKIERKKETDFDRRDSMQEEIAGLTERYNDLVESGERFKDDMIELQLDDKLATFEKRYDEAVTPAEKAAVAKEYVSLLDENTDVVTLGTAVDELSKRDYSKGSMRRFTDGIESAKAEGKAPTGVTIEGDTYVFTDAIRNLNGVRTTTVHERQHRMNRADRTLVNQVMRSLDPAKAKDLLRKLSKGTFYDNAGQREVADEITAYAMEAAYDGKDLDAFLGGLGMDKPVIDLIKSEYGRQQNNKRLAHARRRGRRDEMAVQPDGRRTSKDERNPLEESAGVGEPRTGSYAQSGESSEGEGERIAELTLPLKEEIPVIVAPDPVTITDIAAEDPKTLFNIATEPDVLKAVMDFASSKEAERLGWTEDQIKEIAEETSDLLEFIHQSISGDPNYDEFAKKQPTIVRDWRDGKEKPTVTWHRNNIEYKFDMSSGLYCINNDGIETVLSSPVMVDLILHTVDFSKYTTDDYLTLYETLRDLGLVVPCKGCFDAAARIKMLPSVAQEFAKLVNSVIDERNADPEAFDNAVRDMPGKKAENGLPAQASTKIDAVRIGVAGDQLTEHIEFTQLLSAEGQTKALADWGGIFRAWQKTGAGRPKDKLKAEPYNGVIMESFSTIISPYGEKTPSFRDKEVNMGTGLRRNSHDEFRVETVIDEIQFMRDAWIKGLRVFKYMKELDDVRLFGKMGVKYNISGFPGWKPGAPACGLDENGDYFMSEESVGGREFPYVGEDGRTHYDGNRGLEEAKKHLNEDVSLSSMCPSMPYFIKALTDVPTPTDKSGLWGSLIPFHSSGATAHSLKAQGFGDARAPQSGQFMDQAFVDYDKGVTNFEDVQNDRFGEGWTCILGKRVGTAVSYGHKIEFANGTAYRNDRLGITLYASPATFKTLGGDEAIVTEVVLDKKGNPKMKDGQEVRKTTVHGNFYTLDSENNAVAHELTIDYNDKVRELGGKYAYKEAADYYKDLLRGIGLLPRFDFEVPKSVFLEMCADARVNPHHPKLGWNGGSWSPADAESYYSVWCDYGMTDPATGELSPHKPVLEGKKEANDFIDSLPADYIDVIRKGLERYTSRRDAENAMLGDVVVEYCNRQVAAGKMNPEVVKEILKKHNVSDEGVNFRVADVTPEEQAEIDKAVAFVNGETAPEMKESVMEGQVMFKTAYHGSHSNFDKFDNKYYGTGEGEAVHGIGTYVSISEEHGYKVANKYAGQKYNWQPKEYVGDVKPANEREERALAELIHEIERGRPFSVAVQEVAYWTRTNWEFLGKLKEEDFVDSRSKRNVYTLEIPDDNGSNYIQEDEIPNDKLMKELKKYFFDTWIESELEEEARFLGRGLDPNWESYDEKVHQVYYDKARKRVRSRAQYGWNKMKGMTFGEMRNSYLGGVGIKGQLEKYLNNIGYIGIKYVGGLDGECAVIFNPNDIKIEDHVMFKVVEEVKDQYAPRFSAIEKEYNNKKKEILGHEGRFTPEEWKAHKEELTAIGEERKTKFDALSKEYAKAIAKAEEEDRRNAPKYDTVGKPDKERGQRLFDLAKERFGTTEDFREAGYIVPDGTMIDLSGKNDGGVPGHRGADHRDISTVIEDRKYSTATEYMDDFINEGAIRIAPELGLISLANKPTKEQRDVLRNYIYRHNNEQIEVELLEDTKTMANPVYRERTAPTRVINDINEFFDNGVMPEGNVMFKVGDQVMAAINVNDATQEFTDEILDKKKTIETRDTNSLDRFIGQRVALLRTGKKGGQKIVGYVDIVGKKEYNTLDEFRADEDKHLVKEGSDYDFKDGKVGYILANPVREEKPYTPKKVSRFSINPDQQGNDNEVRFRAVDITPEVRQEMEQIAAVARVNGTYMKAPNGMDSKLNEEQWAMVRTNNFKEWFGDWENDPENASKVVDEETGEPMVVYHGTSWNPMEEKDGDAFFKSGWFTSIKSRATGYGEPVAVFINMRKPAYSENVNATEGFDLNNPKTFGEYDGYLNVENYPSTPVISEIGKRRIKMKNPSNYEEVIAEHLANMPTGKQFFSIIPVSPDQIKSATDNNGEFSRGNDDIRFRTAVEKLKTMSAKEKREYYQKIDEFYTHGETYFYTDKVGDPKVMRIHATADDILNMNEVEMNVSKISKEESKALYKNLPYAENVNTGEMIDFNNDTFDKEHHDLPEFYWIAPHLGKLYESAILAYSEPEQLAGKKRKQGSIHHSHDYTFGTYINKISLDGEVYFVRMTIQRQVGQPGLHYAQLSSVDIQKESPNISEPDLSKKPEEGTASRKLFDTKVNSFFGFARGKHNFRKNTISVEQEYEYIKAVHNGNQEKALEIVSKSASSAGAILDKDNNPVCLYHGTPRFGFTIFNEDRDRGVIYTTTRRTVAANYGGQGYAAVREIRKGIKEGDSIDTIISNWESFTGQKVRIATTEERERSIADCEAKAIEVKNRLEELYKDYNGDLPNDESGEAGNAVAWMANLFYDAANHVDMFEAGNDTYDIISKDVTRYQESKDYLRKYRDDNYEALCSEEQRGNKAIIDFLLHWKSGDVAIDIQYGYMNAVYPNDVLIDEMGSIALPGTIKDSIDKAKDIGAYQLFGFANNILEVECNENQWYNIEFNGVKTSTDEIVRWAKENGYDAVHFANIYDYGDLADDYVFFNSNQVKSADPVTYDDKGNVIPLSERFNKTNPDIRFRFIGEEGAKRADAYDQGERIINHSTALEMEAAGKDAKTIKIATGWEKGVDGKWRYEEPDMKFRNWLPGYYSEYKLSDIINDKTLFEEYPFLKDTKVTLNNRLKRVAGSANSKDNEIELGHGSIIYKDNLAYDRYSQMEIWKRSFNLMDKVRNAGGYNVERKGTAAIEKEYKKKFGVKSKKAMTWEQTREMNAAIAEDFRAVVNAAKDILTRDELMLWISDNYPIIGEEGRLTLMHEVQHMIQDAEGFARGGSPATIDPAYRGQYNELLKKYDEVLEEGIALRDSGQRDAAIKKSNELVKIEAELNRFRSAHRIGEKGYNNLAGEVEARNVEARSKMSAEERRNTLASETEDVNRGDQNVMFRVTPEQDAEYMKAVTDGDMDKAQQMVDEAAKGWGAILDKNGNSLHLYHGTEKGGFTEFDPAKSDDQKSFFFTPSEELARTYSGSYDYINIGENIRDVDSAKEAIENMGGGIDELYTVDYDSFYTSKEELLDEWSLEDGEEIHRVYNVYDPNGYSIAYAEDKTGDDELIALARTFGQYNMEQQGILPVYVKLDHPMNIDARGANWSNIYAEDSQYRMLSILHDSEGYKLSETINEDGVGIYGSHTDRTVFDSIDELYDYVENKYNQDVVDSLSNDDQYEFVWNESAGEIDYGENTRDIAEFASDGEHDGVIIRNVWDNGPYSERQGIESQVVIAFNPASIKSSNPVTYDNEGNAIPLSERFNEKNEDIRFKVGQVAEINRKGISKVLGEEVVNDFLMEMYNSLPEETRRKINEDAVKRGGRFGSSMISFFEEMAQKDELSDLDARIVEAARGDLEKLLQKREDENTEEGSEPKQVELFVNDFLWMMYAEAHKNDPSLAERIYNEEIKRGLEVSKNVIPDMTLQDFLEAASKSKDDLAKEYDAMKASALEVDAFLNTWNTRKEYDRISVGKLVALASDLLKGGLLDEMRKSEVRGLMIDLRQANGMVRMQNRIDNLYDIVLENMERRLYATFEKLLKSRAYKIGSKKVREQGSLDLQGQKVMKTFNEGRDWYTLVDGKISSSQELIDKISKAEENMQSVSEEVRNDAALDFMGYSFAQRYIDNVKSHQGDIITLKDELKDAKVKKAEGKLDSKAFRQLEKEINKGIRESRAELVTGLTGLVNDVHDLVVASHSLAKDFIEADKKRRSEIQHNANSDMEGMPDDVQGHKKTFGESVTDSWAVKFFFGPLSTFDQMLRAFGRKSPNGEGYLWNRFMRQWLSSAENEYLYVSEAMDILDKKVQKLFKNDKMKWSDLYALEGKKVTNVKFYDGSTKKDHYLTQGNLLYILLADQMTDGRMKLRAMGITEEEIETIRNEVEPRFLELAKWVVEDFLPSRRGAYDEVHKRMFGAPMAKVENYFPLHIAAGARSEKVDMNEAANPKGTPSTVTGNIIARTRNTRDLDIFGTDAFSAVIEHVEKMEHWRAFAEFNRDLGDLLSYSKFHNRVRNMNTIYGNGKALWKKFCKVSQMAAGSYRPAGSDAETDKAVLNFSKGVSAAKITFRIFTAIKQLSSYPAYFASTSPKYLAEATANPRAAWKWAYENLPLFKKRWTSRQAGDNKLDPSKDDWSLWRNDIVQKISQWGMTPNAFVDGVTVAIGSYAIYKTRYDRYIKEGYTPERSDYWAKQDATILYNETQQSNEVAFLSPMQVDRTVPSSVFSLFRNSSMGYQRMLHNSIRSLGRMMEKDYKSQSIEFLTKQGERNGLDSGQAKEVAEKFYKKQWFSHLLTIAVFGYVMQFFWNMMSKLPYLVFGRYKKNKSQNEAKKKRDMLEEVAIHSLFGGIEGLAAGNVMSDGLYGLVSGKGFGEFKTTVLPVMSDIEDLLSKADNRELEAIHGLIALGLQAGLGTNPQTFCDAILAVWDCCHGDVKTSKEAMILALRVINAPQSAINEIYFDEIEMSGQDAKKLSVPELAERYAEYKVRKNTGLLRKFYSDVELDKVMKAYEKQFNTKAKDRLEEGAMLPEIQKALDDAKALKEREEYLRKHEEQAAGQELTELMLSPEYSRAMRVSALKEDLDKKVNAYIKSLGGADMVYKYEEMLNAREALIGSVQQDDGTTSYYNGRYSHYSDGVFAAMGQDYKKYQEQYIRESDEFKRLVEARERKKELQEENGNKVTGANQTDKQIVSKLAKQPRFQNAEDFMPEGEFMSEEFQQFLKFQDKGSMKGKSFVFDKVAELDEKIKDASPDKKDSLRAERDRLVESIVKELDGK